MPEDENPFENVPDDFADAKAGKVKPPVAGRARGRTEHPDFRELARLSPRVATRGRLAMGAGGGFVLLAVLVYVGIVRQGDFQAYTFGMTGMVLSALVAFFFMLDDLRIRPHGVTERKAKFVAGIMWMLLLLLCFFMTGSFWPDYLRLVLFYAIFVLTNASFALFFHSMLWED